jgi:hypothetical protein
MEHPFLNPHRVPTAEEPEGRSGNAELPHLPSLFEYIGEGELQADQVRHD